MTSDARDADGVARGRGLVRLFHSDPDRFSGFSPVAAADVPPVPRSLLDHRGHMTTAMERHHRGPVRLTVVARSGPERTAGHEWYAREILLSGPDGGVVQFGIVRIDLAVLEPAVAAAVRQAAQPLGRILVDAGVLCDVQHVRLLRVMPGPELRSLFGVPGEGETYGRVAEIEVSGRPAVQLLEIVAPGRVAATPGT